MKFKNLIETIEVLTEDIESMKKYYPNISDDAFQSYVELDPTYKNGSTQAGKYAKWILGLANRQQLTNIGHVKDVLSRFDEEKNNLINKDIMKYKSVEEVEAMLNDENSYKELSDRQRLRQTQKAVHNTDLDKDAEKLFDGKDWEIWTPHTYEASCKLGRGTQWCTASTESDHYFNSYASKGRLYIIINKHNGDKYQFHFESTSFMDAADESIPLAKFLLDNKELNDYFYTSLDEEIKEQIDDLKELADNDYVWVYHGDIPKKIKYVFRYIEKIIVERDITRIPDKEFYKLIGLKEVVLHDNITHIGESAFEDCENLEFINLPHNLEYLGDYAFDGCVRLKSIKINSELQMLPMFAFSYTDVKRVDVPGNINVIGNGAFCNTELQTVVLNEGVQVISSHAFSGSDKLTSIKLPRSLNKIDSRAFRNCTLLEKIVIPKEVEYVGHRVFGNCPNLTVYCEAEEQPSRWETDWNHRAEVVWGYKGEEVKESYNVRFKLMTESLQPDTLYFLSDKDMNGQTLEPRVPSNYMTKNGYEDAETPRVCFANSIDGALKGLSQNLTGKEFYVHTPVDIDKEYLHTPSKEEVPDAHITTEVWYTQPIKVKTVGKIKVISDDGKEGLTYTYGDGESSELYGWSWEWKSKIEEALSTKIVRRDNPNDFSPFGYKVDFYDGKTHIGEGSVCGIKDDNAFLYDFEVYPEHRGKGYSKEMLQLMIDKYDLKQLYVQQDNTVAVNLYKKFGFKVDGEVEDNGKPAYDMIRESYKMRFKYNRNSEILTEGTKYDKKAVTLLVNSGLFNEEVASNVVTALFKEDIHAFNHAPNWLEKYLIGIVNMLIAYCNGDPSKASRFLEESIAVFDEYLTWVKEVRPQVDTNKQLQMDKEFNEQMSYQELVAKLNKINSERDAQSKERLKTMDFDASSDYELIPIDSFDTFNKLFGGRATGDGSSNNYAGAGGTAWCHANNRSTYDQWVKNDTSKFFVLANKKWKSIPFNKASNTRNAKDDYGTSLIAILVNKEIGNLLRATLRCNHVGVANNADNQYTTYADLSAVAGFNVAEKIKEELNISDTFDGSHKSLMRYCASIDVFVRELTTITIPDGVSLIDYAAFEGCSSLTSVTIPDSVTTIGDMAFSGCKSLKSVVIPNSVTSIGETAFRNCTSLTNITIPDGVTTISYGAFWNCESLMSITIPDSVTSIDTCAFYKCSSLKSITIPNSVINIDYGAFEDCSSLTNVVIGNSVTSIGDDAFKNCKSLTRVTIPNSVTSIGVKAFTYCRSLTTVQIGSGVTEIGSSAFLNCTSLESVVIPDSVTSIGSSVFSGCTRLLSVTIPNSVTKIGKRAFYGCELSIIRCAKGSYAERYADECGIPTEYLNESYTMRFKLTEGKNLEQTVQQYIDKYKKIVPAADDELHRNQVMGLIAIDPTYKEGSTTTGDYAIWILNMAIKNGWDVIGASNKLLPLLTDFIDKKSQLPNKDINSYKSAEELEIALKNCTLTDRQKERKSRHASSKTKKVLDTENWSVYAALNYEGALTLGRGTTWCTATSDNAAWYVQYVTDLWWDEAFEAFEVRDHESARFSEEEVLDFIKNSLLPEDAFEVTSLQDIYNKYSDRAVVIHNDYDARLFNPYDTIPVKSCDCLYVFINKHNASDKYQFCMSTDLLDIEDTANDAIAFHNAKDQKIDFAQFISEVEPELRVFWTETLGMDWYYLTGEDDIEESYNMRFKLDNTHTKPINESINEDVRQLLYRLNSLPVVNSWKLVKYELAKQYEEVLKQFNVGTVLSHQTEAGVERFTKTEGDSVGWWEHYRMPWKKTERCTELDIAHWLAARGNISRGPIEMKNIPQNIDEEFLTEDIEAVRKNYPNISDEDFDKVIRLDPTFDENRDSVGTYGKWLLTLFKKNKLDNEGHVTDVLNMFEQEKKNLKNKDIGQFKSIEDVDAYLNDDDNYTSPSHRQEVRQRQKDRHNVDLGKEAYLVYEDNEWEVWIPKTYAASCKLGQGTRWCTASTETSDDFDAYAEEDYLYININKKTGEKFQFHFSSDSFMDKNDKEINIVEWLIANQSVYREIYRKYINIDGVFGFIENNPDRVFVYRGERVPHRCCNVVREVVIPNSVTSIGDSAFYDCDRLTSITIPDSVTSIDDRAFEKCRRLTSVHITDIAAWCSISFGRYDSNPLYYAGNLYLNGELVTELIIPEGVTTIGSHAFFGCDSLTSIVIPDSVTTIGDYAFRDCRSLTSVIIGDSVTSIGNHAFYNCKSLTSVTIGNSVKSIGEWAFYDCRSLTSTMIPDSVKSIGDYAFEGLSHIIVSRGSYAERYAKEHNIPVKYLNESYSMRFTLTEDIAAVRKNYPKISDEDFDRLIKLDPTYREGSNSVGTYGKWILNLFNKGKLDNEGHVFDILTRFEENKKNLKNKDIGKFKTLEELDDYLNDEDNYKSLSNRQVTRQNQNARRNADLGKDAELVFESSNWQVWVPHTYAASCKLGEGSRWCTASTSSDYYYNYYSKNGKLYINIDKRDEENKYQFHFETCSFMDINDSEISLTDFLNENDDLQKFYYPIIAESIGVDLTEEVHELNLEFDSKAFGRVLDYWQENYASRNSLSSEFIQQVLAGEAWELFYFDGVQQIRDSDSLPALGSSIQEALKRLGLDIDDLWAIVDGEGDDLPYAEEVLDALDQATIDAVMIGSCDDAYEDITKAFTRESGDGYQYTIYLNSILTISASPQSIIETYLNYSENEFPDILRDDTSIADDILVEQWTSTFDCYEPHYGWNGFSESAFIEAFYDRLYEISIK